MSDIEILLRELINKVEYLNHKIDKLDRKVNMINKTSQVTVRGNDSIPLHLITTNEILPTKNTQEIKDE